MVYHIFFALCSEKMSFPCGFVFNCIPRVGENFFTFPLVGESEIWYDMHVHKEKQS